MHHSAISKSKGKHQYARQSLAQFSEKQAEHIHQHNFYFYIIKRIQEQE